MILTIYIIIFSYFLLGGIGFYFINRRKEKQEASKNWTKYISYFIIIHILFFSIIFEPLIFHYIGIIIIMVSAGEIINLFLKSGFHKKLFFTVAWIIFLIFSAGFLYFSQMDKGIILFTFLVLSIFDAFSQISGQLTGKKKIMPNISPGKTVEGLAGGAIIAIGSSLLLRNLINENVVHTLTLAAGIALFAFIGDISCSLYKRKYNVKDFSNLLPGQGGFLDRFDSLIAGGAFMAAFVIFGF